MFVPPPTDQLGECLNAFERFLHDEPEPTSPLLRAALAHVQFETIHPFLDGNGRIGRSLIVLQLVLVERDRALIGTLGRAAASAWALHDALAQQNPLTHAHP